MTNVCTISDCATAETTAFAFLFPVGRLVDAFGSLEGTFQGIRYPPNNPPFITIFDL
jgi:hypothetical protein